MSSSRGNVLRRLTSQIAPLAVHEESVQAAINSALGPVVAPPSAPLATAPLTSPPSPPPVSTSVRARSSSPAPLPKKAPRRSLASQLRGSAVRVSGVADVTPRRSLVSQPRGSVARDPGVLAGRHRGLSSGSCQRSQLSGVCPPSPHTHTPRICPSPPSLLLHLLQFLTCRWLPTRPIT